MKLWTIQPIHVYQLILETGAYRCETEKCQYLHVPAFDTAYRWLAEQMRERIGPPPDGTEFPVWAWHTWDWKHIKPDMRRSEFKYFKTHHVLLELEIPDEQVLLTDHGTWHFAINDSYFGDAKNDAEFDEEMAWFDTLPADVQTQKKRESWTKIMDVTPVDTDWAKNGQYIQATFWELRRDNIKKVWHYRQ